MQDIVDPRVFLALSKTEFSSPALLSPLSDSEHRRTSELASAQRRDEFACARGLLRHLLERATGRSADSHVISSTKAGKPVCIDGPGVSISHANGIVVCAVALSGDVGIDIEFLDHDRNVERLAMEYFSSAENDWLRTQPGDSFYKLWVLKEAWLKAVGAGLGGGLDSLQCRIDPPFIEATVRSSTGCQLNLFETPGAYIGLATTHNKEHALSISQWDPAADKLVGSSSVELLAAGMIPGGR